MAKYIIKDNLPIERKPIHMVKDNSLYTAEAKKTFFNTADYLADLYDTKVIFRNEKGKPLRGTIKVEIDGFYYYVELFKEK